MLNTQKPHTETLRSQMREKSENINRAPFSIANKHIKNLTVEYLVARKNTQIVQFSN